MLAILDCGTTNTKCYLIDSNGNFLHEKYIHAGCRLNVETNEQNAYGKLLSDVVHDCISEAGFPYGNLETVIAFGMVSSDLGLIVVPHMKTPASMADLRNGVFDYSDSGIFGKGVRFLIIRGVKNALAKERDDENVDLCDFMRGEETQVAGVRSLFAKGEAFNVVTLGTHFKIVHCDEEGTIRKSMTTMSGQMFDCIVNQTIIGKSLKNRDANDMHYSRKELIALSNEMLERYGFNRAILLPRFMDSFCNFTPAERMIYLDGVIANDDIHSMNEFLVNEELKTEKYIIIGQKERSLDLEEALRLRDPDIEVTVIDGSTKNRNISIAGVLSICRNQLQKEI